MRPPLPLVTAAPLAPHPPGATAWTGQVVVVGGAHDMDAVSSVVLSLVVLVRPLSWCGLILPLTPSKLHPYIEAPIPLIVGVTAVPEGVDLYDTVMVDLTKGTVRVCAPHVLVCHCDVV